MKKGTNKQRMPHTPRRFAFVFIIILSVIGGLYFQKKTTEIQAKSKEAIIESTTLIENINKFEAELTVHAHEEEKEKRMAAAVIEREIQLAEEIKAAEESRKAEELLLAEQAELDEAKRIAEVNVVTGAVAALENASPVEIETDIEETTNIIPSEAPDPIIQNRTDGFNYYGSHFDIRWFSGSGQVPADQYIYQWSEDSTHYLVERMGAAGSSIRQLGVGSQIMLDNQAYTIFRVDSGVANDSDAYYNMKNIGATITFQTCDASTGANGRFDLTIWYAHPS